MNHQRSSFDRSHGHKTTFNVGEVVPVLCEEVLPGDTFSVTTSKVARMQTLLAPVFDNMYLDTYYFFVPNRLTWSHWKEFMGENTKSAWIPTTEYSVPTLGSPTGGFDIGTIADKFGLPTGVEWSKDALNAPIALPFRAYALIINDFFRDQNVQDPLLVPTGDANATGSNGSGLDDVALGGRPFIAAKYHDYFTSCLPGPQKGPTVAVPARIGMMQVAAWKNHNLSYTIPSSNEIIGLQLGYTSAASNLTGNPGAAYLPSETNNNINIRKNQTYNDDGFPSTQLKDIVYPTNLWAMPTDSGSLAVNINDLRLATVTQMYYEALARGGSRYEEQIAQFFGVDNPDSRIQHPEYLGGNRVRINVHEVTNTAQSETDFLGDLGARSVTADTHADFTKSFTEHGWLIGLCVVRYDHSYSQGIERKFLRKGKFDYYNPIFARIGEQPVYDVELYADADSLTKASVFGYQEAWASYRYSPNRTTGELRPGVSNTLGHWVFTDYYKSKPVLSSDWIREDKGNVDRALAVASSVSNQLFCDFYFDMKCVRPMPMYSVPGAIGQF
nr:major head protein [Microvirus sp.]